MWGGVKATCETPGDRSAGCTASCGHRGLRQSRERHATLRLLRCTHALISWRRWGKIAWALLEGQRRLGAQGSSLRRAQRRALPLCSIGFSPRGRFYLLELAGSTLASLALVVPDFLHNKVGLLRTA